MTSNCRNEAELNKAALPLSPFHRASRASALALAVWFSLLTAVNSSEAGAGFLQISNGYFWDPATANYFIPRGFGYQTLNPPVGANQTFDQLEYDLREFKKMHVNSVRAEFVWNTVETNQGVFDWSKPDFLVAKAEELGLKLFMLVGYQYAPSWFPYEWDATNDAGEVSVVLNYEHPQARLAYSNYIYQVASRYKDNTTIAAWILGNEYAYFDLWNTNHSDLGFDSYSLASYQQFLSAQYDGNINNLNATWNSGTNYASFDDIPMFQQYPPNRNNPGYNDLILWRENSIGRYVAVGATAASLADPNHLRSYSMVGGLFIGNDANYTCEDAKTIVACCAAAGAPLHFWSINNYDWATTTAELRSTDSGIAKHIANSGLPVLVTETGDSTTDDLLPGAAGRQPAALPTHIWEGLMSGAIGVHIFTWNDRDLFNGVFIREKGFGVVQQSRLPKPSYTNVANMFCRLENLQPERLFPGSYRGRPDIALFWPKAAVMGWPRANQENAMLWDALKRVGYQLAILDDARFAADAYTNASALLLSRCYQMDPADLDRVATNVIPRGIHVHANADLPGQFDAHHHPNPNWTNLMSSLFGLNVSRAYPGLDSGVTYTAYDPLFFHGVNDLGPLTNRLSDRVATWKIWHGLTAAEGTSPTNTIVTQTGDNGSQAPMPALQILSLTNANLTIAKTAVNTFALCDLSNQDSVLPMHDWDVRYDWLQAIYGNHFGLQPAITLSGTGANYVLADYRYCTNGSLLISILNEVTNPAVVTLTATNLLAGKTIENLTSGGILETNSDGAVTLNVAGDDFVLLYAYTSSGGVDQSLLNTSPNKLWIASAPLAVWPTGSNYNLTVGYDLRDPNLTLMASFEHVLAPNLVFAQTNAGAFSGAGTVTVSLPIPDADLNNPWYISSHDGGQYVFHAWLLKNGSPVADSYLPVRLLWAVRPLSLPSVVTPGSTYQVPVTWQELPSWLPSEAGCPLDRARLWQPYLASQQYYGVILQLRSAATNVVASQEFLTNIGSDTNNFTLTVPRTAGGPAGPFTWNAYLEIVPNASEDLVDSFEDRDTGADPTDFAPWQLGIYAENTNVEGQMFFAAGVNTNASDGQQAVFIVITNPPAVGSYSGFYLSYAYAQPWALPRSPSQWTNYTFAADFKEADQLNTILELQLKDARGGQIHFTKPYNPASNGWDTISASLDQFTVPPWVGFFDSETVSQLVVNVQMQGTAAMYQGSLDNIRFVGLKTPPTGAPLNQPIWDDFDNRNAATGNNGWAALAPWSTYVYPPPNSRELNQGIAAGQGIAGGQAAFMVVTNPANVGSPSVFGLYTNFINVWSLPTDPSLWTNYVFSYSFKEASGLSCSVEMQVKSGANNWIEFDKPYMPGTDGWYTVSASLDQFVQPQGIGLFDPTAVQAIALNIRVFQTNVTYIGFFDDVYFDTPAGIPPTEPTFGIYLNSNDSPPDYAPLFNISIQPGADGQMVLSWPARTNLQYSVEYQDFSLGSGGWFLPLAPLTNLTKSTNGLLSVTDTNAPSSSARFYRVSVQPP